jgi:hypothetical protein
MRFNRRRKDAPARRDGKQRLSGRNRWTRSLETLERRELLAVDAAAPWHNSANPRDVNHDNRITPLDALVVFNDLLTNGVRELSNDQVTPFASTGPAAPTKSVDVNGDNMVTPLDALRVVNALAVDDQAQISVIATDLLGNPISTIPVGSQFQLRTVVQDVRVPPSEFEGVFAAYLKVSYDSSLATIPTSGATFTFDPFFSVAREFDTSTPGLIAGAGASSSSFDPPGSAPQTLWSVVVTASAGGVVTFTPSFDSEAGHDVALYGSDEGVPADAIDFVGTTLTITQEPTITVTNVTLNEGNAGTTPFVFTVDLSNSHNLPVTVQYTTASPGGGNAATAGVDYTAKSGTLTFSPGTTQQVVTVLVNGDLTVENNEIFNLVLSNPTNGILGTASTGIGTIVNDDVLASLTIGDVTVQNVTSGTTNAVFTVSLSPAATSNTTVQFATANGTGVAGTDYTATSGTLTFTAGASTRTITVPVIGNNLPDDSDTFVINLSNASANATIADPTALGTILPAVPIPNVLFGNAAVTEGNSGTTNMVFTVSLSSASTEQVILAYATFDGTASTVDNDYVTANGSLTFAPGVTQQLITVTVNGDTALETSETFTVNLTQVAGTLGTIQSPATGTINNDDGPPIIEIDNTTVIGSPSDTVNAVFTVTLSVTISSQVTVSYATADGTAEANVDYLPQSGILVFTPGGPLSQTITVPVLPSASAQGDETFFVNLSSATGGAVIGDSQALGTIVRQGLTILDMTVLEGNSGPTNAVFSIVLSQAQEDAVTVQYSTADGTATVAGGDYAATSGTVTFAPGATLQTVTVAVSGDTAVEPNETFTINLSNASGSVIFDGTGIGTILNDDGQKALIELRLADASGVEFASGETLNVNDDFQLLVFVQDIQADPNGIAAAYLDVLYDSNLVAVTGPIVFGPTFNDVQSGNTSTPGLLDEVGAFQSSQPADPGAAQLLFSIPLRALDVGVANFVADPADVAGHDVLEFTSDLPIPSASVNFVDDSINIGANVFTIDSVSQAEGNAGGTSYVFTVTRFLSNGLTATVVYSTSDGTATAGSDYAAVSGTLTFVPGDTSKTVTVTVNGDTTDETDETFFVALSDAVGAVATESPGVGTITNDDGPPGLSVADRSGDEGADLVFTVSLSQASGKPVTVAYTTANALSGTPATAGVDYTPVAGTLTFDPGVAQQTITVPLLADLVVDDNETFRVVLSDPTNATLAAATAIGTIIDVPPAAISGFVYVDSNNSGLKEGSEVGIQGATIQALHNGVIVSTTFTAADGSYSIVGLQPGTYTIRELQPGFYLDGRDTRFGVDSPTNDLFAGVVLTPSANAGGYNFGEGTLRSEFVSAFLNRRAFLSSSINNPPNGALYSLDNIDLTRGDAWISIDGGWQGPRSIKALFDASQGSATLYLYNNAMQLVAVSSATSTGGQMTYSGVPGAAYFLKISGTNQHVELQLVDTLSIGNVTQFEGHTGTTNMVFTAMLSAAQSQTVTVDYNTVDGTASASAGDYVATSGQLTFAPGEVSKLVTVVVNGDTADESDETFSVQFSLASNIEVGVSAGVGTILNDDATSLGGPFFFGSSGPPVTPSAAPSTTTTGDEEDAEVAASVTSPTEPMIAAPMVAMSSSTDEETSVTDAALEDDEDWVTELMLA